MKTILSSGPIWRRKPLGEGQLEEWRYEDDNDEDEDGEIVDVDDAEVLFKLFVDFFI